jgi:hypothetical protein
LSTAENDTRFFVNVFSTIVQLTKRCCLEYGVQQGTSTRETLEMWGAKSEAELVAILSEEGHSQSE